MTESASEEGKVAAIGGGTRWTRRVVLGVVCALVIGVYAWSANSGMIEFAGLKAENTYYNLLVQGFRAGQLNLKTAVPLGLAQLADPYDPLANDPYRRNYGHPLHDSSYYKGKLYIYYGITPALVLFWPYAALTGHYLLHKDAVVIFFSIGFLAGAGLLLAVWRRYFAAVRFWIIASCVLALGLANFTPAILRRCDVYEVAISCGYAMTMLALAGIWGALHDARRQCRWLAAASLAYGLAVGARPSLLFGAIILLVPAVQAWREKRPVRPLLMAATVPIMLIGLGLMFYNAMRFDNPLDFGQRHALSAYRQDTMEQFSLRYLWFNFQVAFLEPARWSGHFPFVHDIVAPALPKGDKEAEHVFGVLTNIPLVWCALAVPLVWRNRSAEAHSILRVFLGTVALLFGICALTIGLHNPMCLRYEVEFAHALVLLAIIGILGLERALAGQPVRRRAARCAWGLLLIFSVVLNLFAGFDCQAESRNDSGLLLLQNGRAEDAIAQYQTALQIDPGYEATHYNLGLILRKQGRLDEAIAQYQKALEIAPDDADACYNLGNIFAQQGRLDDAMAQYQKALEIKPDYAEAHYNLGNIFGQQGRLEEAMGHLQKALEIQPAYAEAQNGLGNGYSQMGRMDQAIAHYQKAVDIRPDFAEARKNLAWVLATCPQASLRDGKKAVQLAERANQLAGGGNPLILCTLAAAYAEAGRFSEAVETAQRALQLARAQSNTRLAGQLQFELKLYQAGRPFHIPEQTH